MLYRRLQIFRWMSLTAWSAIVFIVTLVSFSILAGIGGMMFDGLSSKSGQVVEIALVIFLAGLLAISEYRNASET